MARRKSVMFSAKPVPAAGPGESDASLLVADFTPAASSFNDNTLLLKGSDAGLSLIGRSVYRAVYVLSFGCVFSTLLLGRLVPGRDIIAKGMADGAVAAKEAAGVLQGRGGRVGAPLREAGMQA